jgi:hypothetical protein
VIDYDVLQETSDGHWYDRLTALLLGLTAVLAAALILVQTTESLGEARGNAASARLAAELTSRIVASGTLLTHQLVNGQRALQVGMEGASRGLVSLQAGDAAGEEIGTADGAASRRLSVIAGRMGAIPDESSPLDPYARSLLAGNVDELKAMSVEQGRQKVLADRASTHSSQAVMGLSVLALAGVFVGLAAVLGGGRAGRALLALAWIAAAGATALLVMASGFVSN